MLFLSFFCLFSVSYLLGWCLVLVFKNVFVFFFIFLVNFGIRLHLFDIGLESIFWLWET